MARKASATKPKRLAPRGVDGVVSSERYRLEGTYERLRRALLSGPQDGRVDQPLSYWVQPTDRRLPIAFLDRPLRELLEEPLDNLMRTPGVGQKKILGFLDLLRRAAKAGSPHEPFGMPSETSATDNRRGAVVEPAQVSEAVWREWREAILRAGFAGHALGRVAPSLAPLPTVIWETPLGEYAELSLSEIRGLKTHGEKRVNAILEVFGAVYEAVSTAALNEQLQLDLTARFVPEVTRWVVVRSVAGRRPGYDEVRDRLARPLVAQVETDLGGHVARLVSERLALDAPAPTVRKQAARLSVTRARVYQLLEDCGRVMAVRWPEGRWLLAPLEERQGSSHPEAAGLIHAVRGIFYP